MQSGQRRNCNLGCDWPRDAELRGDSGGRMGYGGTGELAWGKDSGWTSQCREYRGTQKGHLGVPGSEGLTKVGGEGACPELRGSVSGG